MDSEDRDHFKTIALVSDERQQDWKGKRAPGTSTSRLDQTSCLQRARLVCGCYRRDEAQDPEAFAAALAAVFGDYPASIVEYAADPRTGVIKKFPMGLPNVGQISVFLDEIQARQDRIARYANLPKSEPYVREFQRAEPNLFVPNTAARYQEMLTKREADTENRSCFVNGHVCFDSAKRDGIMVPHSWWDEGRVGGIAESLEKITRRIFERECQREGLDPNSMASPQLLKQIKERARDAETL